MNATNDGTSLSEQIRILVAIGAAGAVNCRPCLEHHVSRGSEVGLLEPEIREATEIGFAVNRGAHAKTKGFIDDVISQSKHADISAQCCDDETSQRTECC